MRVRFALLSGWIVLFLTAGCTPTPTPPDDSTRSPNTNTNADVDQADPPPLNTARPPAPPRLTPLPEGVPAQGVDLRWSAVPGAVYYKVYCGNQPDPAEVYRVLGTEYRITGLSTCTEYHWRIVAVTSFGDISSLVGEFRTECAANLPQAVAYPEPPNRTFGVPDRPTLRWSPAPGAVEYEVYFGDNSAPALLGKTARTEYSALPSLAAGRRYYWRVATRNSFGAVTSETWNFELTWNPAGPETPAPLSPADRARGIPRRPTLEWKPSAGATNYQVYLGTSADAPLIATVAEPRLLLRDGLPLNASYWWRVVARGPTGETPGPARIFRTAETGLPPVAPTNPRPFHGAGGVSGPVDLRWDADADTDDYEVQLAVDNAEMLTLGVVDESELAWTPPAGARRVTWRVIARNAFGETMGSESTFLLASGTTAGSPADPNAPTPPATPAAPSAADGCMRWISGNTPDRISISADGNLVAYTSGSSVWVYNDATGQKQRVSVTSDGSAADGSYPALSADGRYVAFQSRTGIDPLDTNNVADVYVHDRGTATTRWVSASGNARSLIPAISGDGRYVAFSSWATNLVTGDTNGTSDMFVADMTTGAIVRVNLNAAGQQGNDYVLEDCALSYDGSRVCFSTRASNVGGSGAGTALCVRDWQTDPIRVVTRGAFTYGPAMSADGRYVVATVSGAQVYVYDVDAAGGPTSTLVSRNAGGFSGDDVSWLASISPDGNYVTFSSRAANFGVPVGPFDLHLWRANRITGNLALVSRSPGGWAGVGMSIFSALSNDGSRVAFDSIAPNLAPGAPIGPSSNAYLTECMN